MSRNVCGGVGIGYVVIKGVDVVGELLGIVPAFRMPIWGQLLHAELDGVTSRPARRKCGYGTLVGNQTGQGDEKGAGGDDVGR